MAKGGPATIDDLLKQQKVTNRLLAAQLRGQMNQTELIALLTDSELTAREIGEILGTSGATVAVTQQRLRDKKRKGPKAEE
jgi:DNA-binding CsgD family transcriptional regulator